MDVAVHLVGGDGERGAIHQGDRSAAEPLQPDLGALQVGEHRHSPAGFRRCRPYLGQPGLVVGIVTVAHVESGHVHSGGDQPVNLLTGRRRSHRAYDFCPAHRVTVLVSPGPYGLQGLV